MVIPTPHSSRSRTWFDSVRLDEGRVSTSNQRPDRWSYLAVRVVGAKGERVGTQTKAAGARDVCEKSSVRNPIFVVGFQPPSSRVRTITIH